MPSEITTKRKSKARHRDVVIASIEERLGCITLDAGNEIHLKRLDELMDELKRSMNGKGGEDGD